MERELSLLNRNIARLRREIRIQSRQMLALLDAELDCGSAARMLMHLQTDLHLFLEKRERLRCEA
jgi:hypothetical protein